VGEDEQSAVIGGDVWLRFDRAGGSFEGRHSRDKPRSGETVENLGVISPLNETK
jgi:hypothetical protein